MLITISALFITQAYWFKKSFVLQESQFDEKINITLRSVADQLLKLDNDSTSNIPPVTKISSNEYYVRLDSYFNLADLDSLLKKEFRQRDININYDYLIINFEEQAILGNTVDELFDVFNSACKKRDDDKENFDFKVKINNKPTYLLNSMGIWVYSSLCLIVILIVFTFIIISILKGKKLNTLKKDFVNNMTHELKTPIANISVASDAIRNKSVQMDSEKLEKYADIIYKENERLHHLVDKVLQISTLEKEEESLTFETIDLHQIINSVIESFEPIIQQRNGLVEINLNAKYCKLKADKTHTTNVIYNLIDNAIKYSNGNPYITIISKNAEDGINISISDKGIGIGVENKERIFDKFFRAETGNLHNTKGFGLGLSYVKLMAEKHKGSISFISEKGIGTTFNLFLPI